MLNKEEWQAIVWFRGSQTGIEVLRFLNDKLNIARNTYEENYADERQRLLVNAYKELIYILSIKPLEQMK